MAEPVRLVVFDCDGTLVDSQAVIVACVLDAFQAERLEPPAPEAVRRIIGLSLVTAMQDLLPDADLVLAERLAEHYKTAFLTLRTAGGDIEPLFPHARETLETLQARGFLLGVATGKAMRGLRYILGKHQLEHHFVTLQTADLHPSKPHPAMLEAAMQDTGMRPAETVFVGDTTYDVLMAKAARVTPIGVAWGYHPVEELQEAGAETVLGRFEELLELLPS